MYSDLLIFPALFSLYFGLNLSLRSLGIDNKLVLLSFMFVFSHLLFTTLNYLQINTTNCKYPEDRAEYSAFGSFLTALIVVIGYILLSIMPALKYFAFPLMILPASSVWIDHAVVAIPAVGSHVLVRYLVRNLINC